MPQRRFSRRSIRTKLALLMSLLIGAISLVIFLYFPDRLEKQAVEKIVEKAHSLAYMAAFSVSPGLFSEDRPDVEEALSAIRRNSDLVYVAVYDRRGQLFAGYNMNLAEQYRFRQLRMTAGPGDSPRGSPVRTEGGFSPDRAFYQATSPIRYNGQQIGKLYLGFALDRLHGEIARSRATIAVVSLGIFLVGIVAVFALSSLITSPLRRIVATAEEIAAGEISKRAAVTSQDEVGQLATSFNVMLDQLEGAHHDLEDLNRSLESRVADRTRLLTEEIEDRTRAEDALRLSEEKYRLLFERNLAGVYVKTPEGHVISCNDACAKILGYETREEFVRHGGLIIYHDQDDRDRILAGVQRDGTVTNQEVRLRMRNGEPTWALENVRLVRSAGGAVLEGILLDINDRKRAEQEIEYKAYHDALTGLPNRTLFKDRLIVALAHARRTNSSLAVMFLDVDDLKIINDTLGHDLGDQLLQSLATRLKECLREEDTVARVGGDEFTLLLPELANPENAKEVAQKVLQQLAEPFYLGDQEIHVTSSIGVTIFPGDGEDPDSLLKNADGTMYRVKEMGGNNFEFYSRSSVTLGRMSLEEELRRAIEREEFVVYYQPQVNIGTREIVGAEALVRWQRPEGPILEPAVFITLAEHTGMIIPIGEWVLRETCRQLKRWQSAGLPAVRLGVNVSPRQFHQRDFIGMVDRALSDTGLDPEFLELEVTETLAMQKTEWTIDMLTRLKDRGISIAIDDFGMGQSSLSYLKRFPVDTLKIDRSFVIDIVRQRSDESIVSAILLLAHNLRLRTIAEGVEFEDQAEFLARHGCEEFQGYLFSRPLPRAAFQNLLLSTHLTTMKAEPRS